MHFSKLVSLLKYWINTTDDSCDKTIEMSKNGNSLKNWSIAMDENSKSSTSQKYISDWLGVERELLRTKNLSGLKFLKKDIPFRVSMFQKLLETTLVGKS